MTDAEDTRTLTAQCYCKAVHFSITVLKSALPLRVHLCHCNHCRYTHGTLCIFHATLPRDVKPEFIAPSSMSALTGYKHATAKSERFFCSTCSAQIGDVGLGGEDVGQWIVASSLFTEHGPDVFQIASHVFTQSAYGGGLAECLPRIGDRKLGVWNPEEGNTKFEPALNEPPKKEFDAAGNERLRAECHCGGVSFTIPRPTVPEVTGDEVLRKFVSPLDKTKWTACMDFCDDCRLMNGTHVLGWTFVPLALLDPPPPPDLAGFGTIKTFDSSPGVRRGFCGTCGATVFYTCDDRTPPGYPSRQIADVAVGVLRSSRDVMATDWLTWRTARSAWPDDMKKFDPEFAEAMDKGLDEWGVRTHGEAIRGYVSNIG